MPLLKHEDKLLASGNRSGDLGPVSGAEQHHPVILDAHPAPDNCRNPKIPSTPVEWPCAVRCRTVLTSSSLDFPAPAAT
jgi:hypothetical protein